MRRRLLTSALAQAIGGISYPSYRAFSWADPYVPVAPTVSKERKCAQCKIGILTGRHCFSCTNSQRK